MEGSVMPATSHLTLCPHPMIAAAGRRLLTVEHRDGETLEGYFRRAGANIEGLWVAWVNGRSVPREAWALVLPRAGDVIVLRAIVEDGGDGGSDPVRTVLSIALLVAAPQLAPGIAGALGFAEGATLFGGLIAVDAVIHGVVSIAGTLAINALSPPPTPTQQSLRALEVHSS